MGPPVAELCGDLGERLLLLLGCPSRETAGSSGGRHSVSTKILVEPMTVRTYSTFPLAIQRWMVLRLTSTRSHACLIETVCLWDVIALHHRSSNRCQVSA